MIRKEIIDAIGDLNFWGRGQKTGICRIAYLKEMEKLLTARNFVVSVIGVRRSGKTFITKQLLESRIGEQGMKKEQTLYVNFEEPSFKPYLSNTDFLDDIFESYRYFLNENEPAVFVLDEVQNIENWESWVRIMLEKHDNVTFIVTGSSAGLLSGELATKLTGRTLTFRVFPLGFGEFLKFSNVDFDGKLIGKTKEMEMHLRKYLEFGGFPEVTLNDDRDVKLRILKELFEGIVSRDIVERHHIRQSNIIKSLATLMMQNFSSPVSVPKIVNIFQNATKRKISPTLINQYFEYFTESYLFFQIPIYTPKVKEQMLYPKKLYCIDTGLIRAASFRTSEDLGRLAENSVFIELMRRRSNAPELGVFYWKHDDKEVDFVIKDGLKVKNLVQVSWNLDNVKTRDREITSLVTAMDEFKLKEGMVLSDGREWIQTIGRRKIHHIPIWKFLLRSHKYV